MATPPTYVADYESAWSSSTTPKSVTPTTAAGDILAVVAGNENAQFDAVNALSGNSLVYTLAQAVTGASTAGAWAWTAPDAVGGAGWTLQATQPGGSAFWGFNALRFSGSAGVGASAKAGPTSGAPSLAITTQADNSALVVVVADFAAVDGATRTWRTVNGITPSVGNGLELTYFRDGLHYVIYVAYYSDAGAAGAKTVGLSAPAGQTYSIDAVEIKGGAGAAASGGYLPGINPLDQFPAGPRAFDWLRTWQPDIPMVVWAAAGGAAAGVTAIGKDLGVVWDVRAPLGDQLQAIWDVRAPLGDTVQLVWDDRAALGDTLQAIWDVRAALGDPLALVWNVRAALGDTVQAIWDVRAALGDEVGLLWNVLSNALTAGKDLALVWNVRAALGDPLALVWNTRAALGDPLGVVWDVRAALGDTVQLVWSIRTPLGKAEQLLWDVRAPLGDTVALVWNTRAALGDPLALLWDVLSLTVPAGAPPGEDTVKALLDGRTLAATAQTSQRLTAGESETLDTIAPASQTLGNVGQPDTLEAIGERTNGT